MKTLNKRGQGLSLTTIIVAALALIVLVVLVAIFLGKMVPWGEKVGEAGAAELATLRISYGDCHPTEAEEAGFRSNMAAAEKEGSEEAKIAAREDAKNLFRDEIDRCDSFTDVDTCKGQGCAW